jgi:hypothetical protein
MPAMASPGGARNPDQAVNDFNVLLMEMFVRQSGIASAFVGNESPDGAMVGDLMTQVLSSQLASQFHLVTAADLFGASPTTEAHINE